MIPAGLTLLPCPLCAAPPRGPQRMTSRIGPDWMIACTSCGLRLERYIAKNGPDDSMGREIAEAWNRRAADPNQPVQGGKMKCPDMRGREVGGPGTRPLQATTTKSRGAEGDKPCTSLTERN